MRQELRGFPLNLLVEAMLYQSIDRNSDSLLHSRAGYCTDLALADSSFFFCTHRFPYLQLPIAD
jgi:hypothetical protein